MGEDFFVCYDEIGETLAANADSENIYRCKRRGILV